MSGFYSGYFYVPKCAKTIEGTETASRGQLKYWDGAKWVSVLDFQYNTNVISVAVPDGHDGEIWLMENCNATCKITNFSTLYSLETDALLAPSDIVELDKEDRVCDE